jgi:DNA-directed RNA polymerase subunit RPC12/RpoP
MGETFIVTRFMPGKQLRDTMPAVSNCAECGGRLRRVHRTFWERFKYLAIYECRSCEREVQVPRHHTYHFGSACRCPRCGTFRVVKLKVPDKIDPMHGGPLNWVERLMGGNLYHCCYCRVQFFDRRPLDPNASRVAARPGEDPVGTGQDAAPPENARGAVSPDQVAKAREQGGAGG